MHFDVEIVQLELSTNEVEVLYNRVTVELIFVPKSTIQDHLEFGAKYINIVFLGCIHLFGGFRTALVVKDCIERFAKQKIK